MYGIIIWTSKNGQTVLIVTNGGTSLVFGKADGAKVMFQVGDLVHASELSLKEARFYGRLVMVTAGFWPEVADIIRISDQMHPCLSVKPDGKLVPKLSQAKADNAACYPCRESCHST